MSSQVLRDVQHKIAEHSPTRLRAAIRRLKRSRAHKNRIGVGEHIIDRTGRVVAQGPFAGMKYAELPWGWEWPIPNLVGSYESELHDEIERLIAWAPPRIIDVGCAEGYYAVGLAMRLPHAQVYAYDINEASRTFCRSMAELNGVADRVHIDGECDHATLQAMCGPDALLIVDIEGAELDLLRPDKAPALCDATIVVELHDNRDPSISSVIQRRFASSHEIRLVTSGEKDLGHWHALQGLPARQQRMAVNERRSIYPHRQQWAVMRPLPAQR
jgi:hypothetical protein